MILFDGDECWVAPRWAFARLARSASMFLGATGDLNALEDAVTRNLLDLPHLDPDRALRLARALRQGAAWLRAELVAEQSGESDEELALSLTPLATQLALMVSRRRQAPPAQGAGTRVS